MKALIFNKENNNWENTKGFELADVPEPVLDEAQNLADAGAVEPDGVSRFGARFFGTRGENYPYFRA